MTNNALPSAFISRMRVQLGADFPDYLAAMAQEPVLSLRVNGLKTSAAELTALAGITLTPNGVCPDGFLAPADLQSGKHPLHAAGLYYFQEASAQLPVELLDVAPGMAVLDLCAAPGGKSTQIAAKLQGSGVLLSNEIEPARAKILLSNLERTGVINAIVTRMSPRALAHALPESFDRVLVDAPCSGEGMFRKDPAAAAHWSPEHVRACALRQGKILSDAAATLKPGGRLVYATCSFSQEENEGVVIDFLQGRQDFRLLGTHRLYPHNSLGEGQFAAVLARDGAVSPSCYALPDAKPCAAFSEFCAENLNLPLDFSIRTLPDGRVLALPPLPFSPDGLHVLRAGLLLGEIVGATHNASQSTHHAQQSARAQRTRFVPAHALAMAGRESPFRRRADVDWGGALAYLAGQTLPACLPSGWCTVCFAGHALGVGKVVNGEMKNHYPKGLRVSSAK